MVQTLKQWISPKKTKEIPTPVIHIKNPEMRKISRIVLHCTATSPYATVAAIQNYWKIKLKWKSPGYHYLIKHDGSLVELLSIDKRSNGVKGFNHDSIHISYIGGATGDTRSPKQKETTKRLIEKLRSQLGYLPVVGHRDLSPDRNGDGKITKDEWLKDCPNFDVAEWIRSVGL